MGKRQIVVSGAAGYVGGAILQTLTQNGYEVITLGRSPCPPNRHLPFDLGQAGLHGVDVDLCGIEAIVHCAYDFNVSSLPESLRVNLGGTEALLSSCQRHSVKRLIHISTLSAFDGCRSIYGRTKLQIEQLFARVGGISLRPGLVYGPKAAGMLGAIRRVVEKVPVVPLIGSGNYPLYLIHQALLARMVMALIESPSIPRLDWITAASATPKTFRAIIAEISPRGPRCRFVPVPWPIVWAGLRLGEILGLNLRLRSDSVIGLVYANVSPQFSDYVWEALGIEVPRIADLSVVES